VRSTFCSSDVFRLANGSRRSSISTTMSRWKLLFGEAWVALLVQEWVVGMSFLLETSRRLFSRWVWMTIMSECTASSTLSANGCYSTRLTFVYLI
jgi:hypothetical protein